MFIKPNIEPTKQKTRSVPFNSRKEFLNSVMEMKEAGLIVDSYTPPPFARNTTNNHVVRPVRINRTLINVNQENMVFYEEWTNLAYGFVYALRSHDLQNLHDPTIQQ